MPYLTYEEYNDLGFVETEIEQAEFKRLVKRAGDVLDDVTGDFYAFNDLEDDINFRRDKFKKAVACQVEYFFDMEATSSHEMNNPLTVQIGRTQVSSGAANQKEMNSLISKDVFMYLRDTGLLYSGIGVR